MPSIVDYPTVLARMQAMDMRCQYYNSGAFGFDPADTIYFIGWIVQHDSTIKPAALQQTRLIPPPFEPNLTRLAIRAWLNLLPGPLWIMPKSQWAFELDFGSKTWLPAALTQAGIDPKLLEGHTDSPAIAFLPAEADRAAILIESLLTNLFGSDFALAFPDHAIACTLHHHKQIWWIARDETIIRKIDLLRDVTEGNGLNAETPSRREEREEERGNS